MLPVHLCLAVALLCLYEGAHKRDDLFEVGVEPVALQIGDLALLDVLELPFNHESILLGKVWPSHGHHRVDNEGLEDEVVGLDWLPVQLHAA